MEFVGRRVRKEFQGRGTFFGSVEACIPSTGLFKIIYDDGGSEELNLWELLPLLISSEPTPLLPELSPSTAGRKSKNPRRIINEGKADDNSVIGSGISGSLVDRSGSLAELGLSIDEGVDKNDDGDHGRKLGNLHGFDLNEGVNMDLHEGLDLNEGTIEESSGVRKKMIDLNLDVNEEIQNVKSEKKERWFDLNVEFKEDEYDVLVGHEGKHVVNVDNEKGNVILNVENKEEIPLENCLTGVDYEKEAPVTGMGRGRKKKEVVDSKIESVTLETNKVNLGIGNFNLRLESREETPDKRTSDSVDCDGGVSGGVSRGRSGRKRIESFNNSITLDIPEPGSSRSSRREKMDSFSCQDYALNATGINNQLSPPTVRAVSDEKITVSGHERFEKPLVLPSKVDLPPSSGGLDLSGVSVFDLVSVYAFLRSFSTLLFLSPFELDGFLTCVKCDDSTLLFDSIHVSLLRTLRLRLVSLSKEGSPSATDCLRSLNWHFLDLITWPLFLVEYLLFHSPGYIPGLDLCHFEAFQSDYYKMPVSAKIEILRHLCDDVIEIEAFRSELNRRTLTTERQDSIKRGKAVKDIASTSSITEDDVDEPTDLNGDECFLCKNDGNLICCDGCPAAFHSRCVGVVSSLLPEGDWYCPECAFDKDKPWTKVGKSIRGAEWLETDLHGRQYYSTCGYLLVLESSNDGYSSWFYKRNDLAAVVEALASSPYLYGKIITAICKHWNITHGVNGLRNGLHYGSYFMSAFPEKRLLPVRHPTASGALNKDEDSAEKRSDEKSTWTTYSCNIEIETSGNINVLLETGKEGAKMENQLSSEGSAEVSHALTMIDTLKEGELDCSKRCSEISDDTRMPGKLVNAADLYVTSTTLKTEQRNNRSSGHGPASSSIDSRGIMPEVPRWTHYVNFYEFARTASSILEELTSKSSDKSSEGASKSVEEITAGEMKVKSNKFAEFFWSNMQNTNLNSRKEKCGWCFYCKVPEDERNCIFIITDSIPAVENFTSEILGIRSAKSRKRHLIDVICHVICIEDRLQGLLLGPWLNPHYSELWRKSTLEAVDLGLLKNLLLQLESNLHHLALSADWRKHVDSVATVGSASHIVRSTARVSLKHATGRRRGKCSKMEVTPSSKAKAGLRLFWWRGGKASRELFSCKVLPCSLAFKAGRQGGCKKMLGIHYPDSGEYAKRMRYVAWRAAVETSRSVEQLALQVRELDANIRWDDIGNCSLLSKMDKESKKPIKSFKKVIIRKKRCEGKVVKYLLDFGKKRFIPDIVVKHGFLLQDSSSERKKYWLEEVHVPLHLLKAFEERRIARTPNKITSGELCESSTVTGKPLKKKGFLYLFSRAERSETYQCGHCNKDILIRKAVSCQYCKGFFHRKHARKSPGSSSGESVYTCYKCQDDEFVETGAMKGKSELPKRKKTSKALKPLRPGKEKTLGKEKQSVDSKKKRGVPLVVPRRSARNAECVSKLPLLNTKARKRKRGKQAKPEKVEIKKLTNGKWQKKRTPLRSSYWLNGLQLSRRENDERLVQFTSKMLLVLSGEDTLINDKPKCSFCCEINYTSKLHYVACEICGVWFHLDALDLGADKIRNIIGFKCHNCLDKRPPVCPHHCTAGSNNAETGFIMEDSQANDESKGILLTFNIEKQSSGSKRQKRKRLAFYERILLENDSVEVGGSRERC